jgi:hypothetical protein
MEEAALDKQLVGPRVLNHDCKVTGQQGCSDRKRNASGVRSRQPYS